MTNHLSFSVLSIVVRTASGLAVVVVSSRLLGVTGFAQFSYALVVGTLFSLIIDYGLDVKLTRDGALRRETLGRIVAATVCAKTLLIAPTLALFALLTFSGALDATLTNASILMLIAQGLYSFSRHLLAPFRVQGAYQREFWLTVMAEGFMIVSFVVGIATLDSAFGAAMGAAIGRLGGLTITAWISLRRYGFQTSRNDVIRELTDGLPFAVHAATAAIYVNIDVLVISKFVSTYDLGIYQAGVRAMMAACILTLVAQNVFLPRLAGALATPVAFHSLKRRFLVLTLIVGVVISTAMSLLDDLLVALLFGEQFADLVPLITVFAFVVLLRYVGSAYGALLTIIPKGQALRAIAAGSSIGVVIVGNLVAAPRYGIQGALSVMVLAHIVINTVYIVYWHSVGARSAILQRS